MNPKVWNPKVFWKVMTIKAATSRTMRHQFVSHRLPVNFQMRMSALNQNVSIHFYLQFNNTMTSDTSPYHTVFFKMELMLWFINMYNRCFEFLKPVYLFYFMIHIAIK